MNKIFNDEQPASLQFYLDLAIKSFSGTLDYLIHADQPLSQKDLHTLSLLDDAYASQQAAVYRLRVSLGQLRKAKLAEQADAANPAHHNIVPFSSAEKPEGEE